MQTNVVLLDSQEFRHRKSLAKHIVLLGALSVLALVFASCNQKPSNQAINTRPECVTLSMYSSVIEQVMNIQPTWDPLPQIGDSHQYQWTIQDDEGVHRLSTILTPDGCVCSTTASSQFSPDYDQGELAGLLQGAAVAPISNLDYTANWLEPKITLSCTFAFAFHRSYEAETSMEDETTWKLTCSRDRREETNVSLTTLTIIAPSCVDFLD